MKIKVSLYIFSLFLLCHCEHKASQEPSDHFQSMSYSEKTKLLIDSLSRITFNPDTLTELARSKGWNLYFSGEFEMAHQLFHFALEKSPENIATLGAFAQTSSQLQLLDQSLHFYKKLVTLDPNYVDAYGSIATLYVFKNQKDSAQLLVEKLLKNNNSLIRREAYSIQSVLWLYEEEVDKAVEAMIQRLAITKKVWKTQNSRTDHPYWDAHLIFNILFDANRLVEAKKWADEGLSIAKSTLEEGRMLNQIQGNYRAFLFRYHLRKNNLDSAYHYLQGYKERNPIGYSLNYSKLLLLKGQPDSALQVIEKYGRAGYSKAAVLGQTYLQIGDLKKTKVHFDYVLNYHQVGNRFWQHEYVLTQNRVKKMMEGL